MGKVIKITSENYDKTIEEGAEILKSKGLVIFPTETVYGLGGNALDKDSSRKIYEAKGRPSDNPLIVHISSLDMLEGIVKEVPTIYRPIIEKFWPGPLTLIMEKTDKIPYETTGGLDTVAVRYPSHKVAKDLITKTNLPLAAPSANISSRPSITDEEVAVKEMRDKVDMIILDDSSDIGLESTILDLTGNIPSILRPGYVEKKDLEEVIQREVAIDANIIDKDQRPKSPGMKYKHYAPKCKIIIVKGTNLEKKKKIMKYLEQNLREEKYLILSPNYNKLSLDNEMYIGKDNEEIAKNLYRSFRKLDLENIDYAFFQEIDKGKMKNAIMDRVNKASGYVII